MTLVCDGDLSPADRLDFLNAHRAPRAQRRIRRPQQRRSLDRRPGREEDAFGGMLGTTFNFVFEVQLENLQNGDRFYYLPRLDSLNLRPAGEQQFAEMIHRNTDATHLPATCSPPDYPRGGPDQAVQSRPDPPAPDRARPTA